MNHIELKPAQPQETFQNDGPMIHTVDGGTTAKRCKWCIPVISNAVFPLK